MSCTSISLAITFGIRRACCKGNRNDHVVEESDIVFGGLKSCQLCCTRAGLAAGLMLDVLMLCPRMSCWNGAVAE